MKFARDIEPEPIDDMEDLDNEELNDDLGLDDDSFQDDFMGDGEGLSPMDKHKDLLRDLTNFDPFLKEKVNGWLGIYWNEEQSKYVSSPGVTPIMNSNCAAWSISFLKNYARENNIITNIRSEEYKMIMADVIEVVWVNIGTRSEEFGIKEEGDIFRVCNELEHAASLVLMGAGDGKYTKFLGSTYSYHGNPNEGNQNNNQPNNGLILDKQPRMSKWKDMLGLGQKKPIQGFNG